MVGKIFGMALLALGAVAQAIEKRQTVTQSGNVITLSGVSSGQVIIIQTNPGGGAAWQQVNNPVATTGKTHTVIVGGASGLVFTPESLNTAVGDVIEFQFQAKNHTVTQSTFAQPCVNAKMFDTGFVPNPDGKTPAPAMRVQVNTTTPTWFYCRQAGHCGKGMVFSVNPTADKTAAMFKSLALAQNGTAAAAPPAATPIATTATPAPTVSAVTAATPSATVAQGTGTTGANGQCSCSCLCGSTSFGNIAAQGAGAFGGFGGMLSPAPGGVGSARRR